MGDVRKWTAQAGNLLIHHLIAIAVIGLAPGIYAILETIPGAIERAAWSPLVLGIGWSATIVGSVIWFHDHQGRQAQRQAYTAQSMFIVSDSALVPLISSDVRKSYGPELTRTIVNELLHRMCEVLAYRIDTTRKGATFLILESDAVDAKFRLFTGVNQDDPTIDHEVNRDLARNKGMAGLAITKGKCLVLSDCTNHKEAEKVGWVDTHDPPRFRARAVAPVVGCVRGHLPSDVGALCFDVAPTYIFTADDQRLLQAFALKIACIWTLLNEGGQGHIIVGGEDKERVDDMG